MAEDGQDKLQGMMDDLAAKQRNILWPQSLRNGRNVDTFLWKGAEKPTASMRIGAFLLGTIYLISALAICYASAEGGSILGVLISFGFLYLGARVLIRSVPKKEGRGNLPGS
jgi:hypothetical protein